jgi:hypothetical protein
VYCTPQDVLSTHELLNSEDFSDEMVEQFIRDAQTMIDTVLKEQYVVPLQDPVPDIIRVICKYKAAALLLTLHFSGVNYREDTPLSVHYERLADRQLERVIEKDLLNGEPGVIRQQPPVRESRPRMASTTPNKSTIKRALHQFDRASRDPWGLMP